MGKERQSRKERRKAAQSMLAREQLRKRSTVLGSALVFSSIAAPITLSSMIAEATDGEATSSEVTYNNEALEPSSDINTITNQEQISETTEQTQETENPSTSDTLDSSTTDSSMATDTNETDLTKDLIPDATENTAEETKSDLIGPSLGSSVAAFSARSISPDVFIAEIAAHAQPVAAANDLYASVMMAQAIIESGWGGSTLSQAPNYNLFGIKGSYQGQTVYMETWEYLNGQWVTKNEPFRKYPSYQESFYDNAYVIKNTSFQTGVYYYSGAWKSNTSSYRDATAWLTGRYATDPTYNTKLNNLIEAYNLTQYDTPGSGGGNTNTGNSNNGGSTGNNTGSGTGTSTTDTVHTVKSGDTLFGLAAQYGTTVANIKSWNNLSGDTIYIGQKLVVKKGTGSSGTNTGNDNSSSNNNSTTNTTHTVKSGDTLSGLAYQYGTTVANLKSWNGLSGDTIYIGQKLVVKQGSTSGGSSSSGSSSSTTSGSYSVKSGDTLSGIAYQYGTTVANLKSWNGLSSDIIYIGQKLVVKQGGSTNTSTNSNQSGKTHTVKSGDTLWDLAQKYAVSVQVIKQLNNLSSDVIYIGQVLKIA